MVLPVILPAATPPPTLDLPSHPSQAHSAERSGRSHVVKAGETLYGLADRYGTTVAAIRERNGLDHGFIHPGQELRIPASSGSTERRPDSERRSGRTTTYTVRPGDTLSGIAARHDVSVARLASLNSLSPADYIHAGDRLRVEGSAATPAKRAAAGRSGGGTHVVRSGETLSEIAARHKMSVSRLAKINGISTRDFVHPGQRLSLSASSGRDASKTTQSKGTSGGSSTSPSTHQKGDDHNTFAGRTYPDSIVGAAAKNRDILGSRAVPSRDEVRRMITETARQHGVDPRLALGLSYQESGWDQRQVSVANAIGVMQVIPSSGDWASGLIGSELDLLDTQDNITAGVVILKALNRLSSSESQAIAGYYQGLASVRANGMYTDTQQYVKNVKALKQRM